jgi:hypothetical protein
LCERKLARTFAHVGAMSSMGVCSKGASSAMMVCVVSCERAGERVLGQVVDANGQL